MNKTKIEYLDYCWNFLTGCNNWKDPSICGGGGSEFTCWAKSMADRFGRDFEPRFNKRVVDAPVRSKPGGRRIGVCFTGDLFGDGVDPQMEFTCSTDWEDLPNISVIYPLQPYVMTIVRNCPDDQFFFLTKCPWNLAKWGKFPDNAWVGVSVTNYQQFRVAWGHLAYTVDAKNKWISFEPLLDDIGAGPFFDKLLTDTGISWLVIGGLSNKPASQQPKLEWIKKIVMAADRARIRVFLKNNLSPLSGPHCLWQGFHRQKASGPLGWGLRQELSEFKSEVAA